MTFFIFDRSSICMISHPETLFSIIVTEKQNQTKLDQCFDLYSSHFWMQTSYYLWTEGTHITAAHFKTIIFTRDIFWSNLNLCPRKKRKERKSNGIFYADIIFSLKGRNSHTLQLIISRHHKDPFLYNLNLCPNKYLRTKNVRKEEVQYHYSTYNTWRRGIWYSKIVLLFSHPLRCQDTLNIIMRVLLNIPW